jgi:hypothetical protein
MHYLRYEYMIDYLVFAYLLFESFFQPGYTHLVMGLER